MKKKPTFQYGQNLKIARKITVPRLFDRARIDRILYMTILSQEATEGNGKTATALWNLLERSSLR